MPHPKLGRRRWLSTALALGGVLLLVAPLAPNLRTPGHISVAGTVGPPTSGLLSPTSGPNTFPTYLGGPSRTNNFTATPGPINVSSAGSLREIWSFTTLRSVVSQVTAVNGSVYFGSWDGNEYSVYANNGTPRWRQPTYLGMTTTDAGCGNSPTNPGPGITSTAAIVGGTLYVNGGNPDLYALNTTNGSILPGWSIPLGGTTAQGYYLWSSPLVNNGVIYDAIASQCDQPLVPAGLKELSLANGSVLASFNSSVPDATGSSIWSGPSINANGTTVFVTTGNAFRTLTSEYDDSIVALNATNLAVRASWQVPAAQQTGDGDFGSTPVLVNPAGGAPMVVSVNKNGYLYAWYQSNLTLRWEDRLTFVTGVTVNAAYGGGRIYVMSPQTTINGTTYAGSVRAIDPLTGNFLWQLGLPAANVGYGAPLYVNGALFVPSMSTLYALNATTGMTLGNYTSSSTGALLGPVSTTGTELFGGWGKHVLAFEVPVTATARAVPGSSPAMTENFTGSARAGLAPYTFNWTFGDGNSSPLVDPSHTYAAPGVYHATLTVTDSAGVVAWSNLTVVLPSNGVPSWSAIPTQSAPSARTEPMMAYDAKDGYVLLFGGFDSEGNALDDTWTYHAGAWTELSSGGSSASPPARGGGALVYDAADGYLLLFGGSTGGGQPSLLNDTWSFSAGGWMNLTQSSGAAPPPRLGAAATFDAADNYTLLFGGFTGTTWSNDTWSFTSAGGWRQIAASGAPAPPDGLEMAYSVAAGNVTLLAGDGSAPSTWSYLGGAWHLLAPGGSLPSGYLGGGLTYDGPLGKIVSFGGADDNGHALAATSTYASGVWTNVSSPKAPPPTTAFGFTYDASDGYPLVFGGQVGSGDEGPGNATWAWSVSFPVVFAQTGLPSGVEWFINITGGASINLAGTSAELETNLTDGGYALSVATTSPSFSASSPGSISVADTAMLVNLTFGPVTYPVTYHEVGLPSGMSWTVAAGTTTENLTVGVNATSLSFPALGNGTYPYSIAPISGWRETAVPSQGTLVVRGSAVAVWLFYGQILYSLTFQESGLPTGRSMNLTIGGITTVSTTGSVVLPEVNGTYAYSINTSHGPTLSGTVVVNAGPTTVSVVYSAITFRESGLPSGTSWSLTTDGLSQTTNLDWMTFELPNGSYSYVVHPVPGYQSPSGGTFTAAGTAATYKLTFGLPSYLVTFSETGLPGGHAWSLLVNSVKNTSTTNSMFAHLANGTYPYTITVVPGGSTSGSVTVAGAPTTVTTAFHQATFHESGLPSGSSWTVTLNGASQTTTATGMSFNLVNGAYSYKVGTVAGYHTAPTGSVTLAGGPVPVTLTFSRTTYVVKFTETGLQTAWQTTWCVTLNGGTTCATGTTAVSVAGIPNGSYSYSIGHIRNYTLASGSYTGSASVSGGGQGTVSNTVPVAWKLLSYVVKFTETGLPSGTTWHATVYSKTVSSTSSVIKIFEPNGTYSYSVSASGYTATPASGEVTLNGATVTVAVSFSLPTGLGAPAGARHASLFVRLADGTGIARAATRVSTSET